MEFRSTIFHRLEIRIIHFGGDGKASLWNRDGPGFSLSNRIVPVLFSAEEDFDFDRVGIGFETTIHAGREGRNAP